MRPAHPDMCDPRVPERQEVLGRKSRPKPVVDLNQRDHGRVDVAVEADDREAILDEPGDPLGRKHQPVDQGAVDVLRAQQAEVASLLLGIALGGAEQHHLVPLQHELLDPADELCVERVRDVGQEQRDGLRRLRDQAARDRVRPVAELCHRLVDRGTGRCGDRSRVVEGAGDRCRRYPGEARDVVDRRTPRSWAAGLWHAASVAPGDQCV